MRAEVLLVGSKDDPQAGWERVQLLHRTLSESGVKVRLINKLTWDLEELHLVARYRTVSTPTILVLKGGSVVARLLGIHSAKDVAGLVERLSD